MGRGLVSCTDCGNPRVEVRADGACGSCHSVRLRTAQAVAIFGGESAGAKSLERVEQAARAARAACNELDRVAKEAMVARHAGTPGPKVDPAQRAWFKAKAELRAAVAAWEAIS